MGGLCRPLLSSFTYIWKLCIKKNYTVCTATTRQVYSQDAAHRVGMLHVFPTIIFLHTAGDMVRGDLLFG